MDCTSFPTVTARPLHPFRDPIWRPAFQEQTKKPFRIADGKGDRVGETVDERGFRHGGIVRFILIFFMGSSVLSVSSVP
jgi:hypothetical protein